MTMNQRSRSLPGLTVHVIPKLIPLLLALAASAAPAQQAPGSSVPAAPPASAPAQGAAPAAPASPVQRAVDTALASIEAGKLEEAIQALEPLRSDPKAPPLALSLLGGLYLEAGRAADAQAVLAPLTQGDAADPAVLYNAGRAALALGRTDEARQLLERSVAKVPNSPAARALGLLLGQENRVEAYRLLRPWALAHPEDSEARLAAALCALDLGRPSEAEQLLSDLPQDDPKVRLLWGRLLIEKRDPRGAIATLKPLEASHPPEIDFNLRRVLADAYLATGQSAEAVKLLTGFENRDPVTARQLAQAHYQGGNLEAALAILKPWAEALLPREKPIAPLQVAALALDYGRLLSAAGRREESADALAVAVKHDPSSVESWQLYGQVLAALGRREESTKALERFRELSEVQRKVQLAQGSKATLREGLARAEPYVAAGQYDEVLRIAREEVALDPGNLRARMLETKSLLLLRRMDEAAKSAKATLALAPESADAHYQMGLSHMVSKRPKEAEAELRRALALDGKHVAAMNDLAVLLMLRGEKKEARELLERVLEIQPEDTLAADNLRKLDAEKGKGGGKPGG